MSAAEFFTGVFAIEGRMTIMEKFESNFVDYPGLFVQHCHVLSHEDLGMMSSIEITP